MPRPGGELDFADRRLSRWDLRCDFLEVVREEVPEVLVDLFRDVLPHYRTAAALRRAAGLDPSWIKEHRLSRTEEIQRKLQGWEERYAMFGPEPNAVRKLNAFRALLALHAELVAWAARYDLTDPAGDRNRWVLKTALETLLRWYEQRDRIGPPQLEWAYRGGDGTHPLSDEERQFAGLEILPGGRATLEEALAVPEEERRRGVPDLLRETREQAERRLVALGIPRRKVRAKLADLEAAFADVGMVRTPTLQKREDDPLRFFRWLARYVCGKVDYIEQAGGPGNEERAKTIGRDCRKLAKLMGLKRPERRRKRTRTNTRRR
jgi:hypothetical protein